MESKRPLPGIVCDIDGVLIRDNKALPVASEAIQMIKKPLKELAPDCFSDLAACIPFVCLTNGGGYVEQAKADALNSILNIQENPYKFTSAEILMNHTALRPIMEQYKDKFIIMTGEGDVDGIAQDIGIQRYLRIEEYASLYPDMVPVTAKKTPCSVIEQTQQSLAQRLGVKNHKELDKPPQIHAIFILNDPGKWYEYLQVICDLVATTDGRIAEKMPEVIPDEHIPIYSTNNDLVYAGKFPLPRLTSGAFNECLKHMYKVLYQKELKIHHYGKPFEVTYRYTEQHLKKLSGAELSNIYMIGDNPKSDIRGARAAGWKTVLVETGVFQKKDGVENDPYNPADYVVADIKEALNLILRLENIYIE